MAYLLSPEIMGGANLEAVGFYTPEIFWAGEEIGLEELEQIQLTDPAKTKLLFEQRIAQLMFAYDTEGYEMKIFKDGLILFSSKKYSDLINSEIINWWHIHLEFANCIFLLLQSSYETHFNSTLCRYCEITYNQTLGFDKNGKYAAGAIPLLSRESEYLSYRFYDIYQPDETPFLDDHRLDRGSIPREVFDSLNENLQKACQAFSNVKLLSSLNRSLAQFNIYNHSTSLVLAWFIIEQYITAYWEKFLKANNKIYPDSTARINSDRQKLLTGRDYTASIVSNMLELTDILDFNIFKKIDLVRKSRNAIVHNNVDASESDCVTAFEVVRFFVKEDMGIDLKIAPTHVFEFEERKATI